VAAEAAIRKRTKDQREVCGIILEINKVKADGYTLLDMIEEMGFRV
jgi:hypothetical protein